MHARVTAAHAQTDRLEDAVASVKAAFLPAARDQPGYAGFLLLVNRDQQQLIGVSFWASEGDLDASGAPTGYYQEQMAAFGALVVEPPTTTTYEVVVRETV